ncbi:MAG: hypothetical protein DRN96_03915 [Thermoproteota archaeon]|nr:MAG: hypothetical protein DRN96_03915 [Candidatus Korarchaeota archaeon]
MATPIVLMAIAGALVGLVSSFFGVGACFIMVPVMMYYFEKFMGVSASLSPLIAFGTNMAVVVPTSLSGLLRHRGELRRKSMRFPVRHYLSFAIPVGVGSFLGSLMAFVFFSSFRAHAGLAMKTLFGFFCLFGAYRFMKAKPLPATEMPKLDVMKFASGGVLSGVIANFIGIGGGIVYMPVLNALLHIPVHIAVPISLATMVVGSSIGASSFAVLGRIDQLKHPSEYPPLSFGWFNLIAWLSIGVPSVLLAQLGPKLAHRTPPARFKILLALVYTYIGVRLVLNGLLQLTGRPKLLP